MRVSGEWIRQQGSSDVYIPGTPLDSCNAP